MTAEPPHEKCFHCGLPVADSIDITVVYQGEHKPMCCYGCQAVSQAIIDSGMDDFYRYRTSNPGRPEEIVPDFLQNLKAYDSESVRRKFVSETGDEDILEVSLILEGITCAACIWLNEKTLNALDGVINADINYSNHRGRIRWDNSRIKLSQILESISRIGYLAHPYDPEQHQHILEKQRKQQLRRLGISALLGMQVMIFAVAMYTGDWWGMDENFRQVFRWSSLALTVPILMFASSTFFISAYRDLSNRRIGMDVPISLGISIAFIASTINTFDAQGEIYFDSVAMFTFFLLSARYFEAGARKQTSEATEALLNLKPTTANRFIDYLEHDTATKPTEMVIQDNAIENVTVTELHSGDYLLVRPGETIPADGVVREGLSGVDESLVTGESLPVTRGIGEQVIGGSINTENPLVIQVTECGENSVLSSLQQLIEDAQHNKPAIARLADRVATWFVTVLLTISAMVAIYWYNTDPDRWLEITIATLVVSCPCALSLATPTAITAASGQLAKIGLLPKRSHALETLAQATDFVFDKTGTLTEGKIKLERVILAGDDYDESQVIKIASALESRSEHPIAKALISEAGQTSLDIRDLKHITGQGIQGRIGDTQWYIGNRDFIRENSSTEVEMITDSQSQIYLATAEKPIATFIMSDSIRGESRTLIDRLHDEHRHTHLMSGDNIEHASRVSEQLGIQHCQAGLSPEDKLARVKQLQQDDAVVVMTGDGVNDAPVLAGADLSIAMGKGTQLAAAAADMILINDHVIHIYNGYRIARNTLQIIRQNLGWALLYNITAIPAAATGHVEPWLAAIGMSASSLVVVLNALRLNRIDTGL